MSVAQPVRIYVEGVGWIVVKPTVAPVKTGIGIDVPWGIGAPDWFLITEDTTNKVYYINPARIIAVEV